MKKLPLALCLLATSAASAAPEYTRNVAIVVYPGVELLDFAGPGEVFSAAGQIGSTGAPGGARAFKVFTVAASHEPVISQGFVKVVPDYAIDDAPPIDVLVIPGGNSGSVTGDPAMMKWVTERAKAAQLSMTVCTGAMVLARAGLLDGRDVTTHYGSIAALRQIATKSRVHDGRRFVDTGNVVTTAGVSAGIDGSLHVVARLLGRYVADRTAQYMEYGWHPESYVAETYPTWNPSLDDHGRKLQEATALISEKRWNEAESTLRSLLGKKSDDGPVYYQIGSMFHSAGRLDQAIPFHKKAAEYPTVRGAALYNLACAYALKKQVNEALATLEQATAAGFKENGLFASDTDLANLRGNPRFEKLVASSRTR